MDGGWDLTGLEEVERVVAPRQCPSWSLRSHQCRRRDERRRALCNTLGVMSAAAQRCRRRFLRFFPNGFADERYLDWERNYKVEAHQRWQTELNRSTLRALLRADDVVEIATRAIRIESRTNLLFSFEKMALRDAIRTGNGAHAFARGLWTDVLHGVGRRQERFERWCETVGSLPRRQTRVLTWPVVTVFPFLAQPDRHIFLKPNVSRVAAARYQASILRYLSEAELADYASLPAFDVADPTFATCGLAT